MPPPSARCKWLMHPPMPDTDALSSTTSAFRGVPPRHGRPPLDARETFQPVCTHCRTQWQHLIRDRSNRLASRLPITSIVTARVSSSRPHAVVACGTAASRLNIVDAVSDFVSPHTVNSTHFLRATTSTNTCWCGVVTAGRGRINDASGPVDANRQPRSHRSLHQPRPAFSYLRRRSAPTLRYLDL